MSAARPGEWWRAHRAALVALTPAEQPQYVLNAHTVRAAAAALSAALPCCHRLWYAMKANESEHVLRIMEADNVGFEVVSVGELQHLRTLFPYVLLCVARPPARCCCRVRHCPPI